MNRFDCQLATLSAQPAKSEFSPAKMKFRTSKFEVSINTTTGLMDRYRVGGQDLVKPGAGKALVIQDDEDPWGMRTHGFRQVIGEFKLLTPAAAAKFAGVRVKTLAPVRIIEDGEVRTVVEALFGYGHSFLCQRYILPKTGPEIGIETRVQWAEKDKMLKLELPVVGHDCQYLGQSAFSVNPLPLNGDEAVAQQWTAVVAQREGRTLTCINDGTYGSDFSPDGLRLTLLRSAAYSAHPIGDRPLVPQNRFSPRIDQGERLFRFWLNGGPTEERLAAIDREALAHNQKPMALSFFPSGAGQQPQPLVLLSDKAIQIAAVKRAEDGKGLIVRLFEPTGKKRTTTLSLPALGIQHKVNLQPWEIRTYRINARKRTVTEVDLMENPVK
jgi:alpha-mannosidase